ncbi:MAG TPA: glutathione peroxidase [Terracidiphilus sp.]|nr:glutathione peroxidase [Terracidiphilus sp.]
METRTGDVYAYEAELLDGSKMSLEEFRGQVLLIVNTASQCGFTPQYEGLERLYRTYKECGFAVLGFPCNQFGQQEPGTSGQIGAFCQKNYGVSFPMFAKVEVNGAGAHPLYQFLKKNQKGFLGTEGIKWNFTKFLVDRQGNVKARFAPRVEPSQLAQQVEQLLKEN